MSAKLEVKKVPLRDKASRVVGTLTMSEDVTRAVNLEKQLRQSQKMEAIGNLSGGIAHDFNNILTSIINSVELSLMDVDADTPAGKDLSRALRAAQRGSALVKQILTFSRPSKEGMVPTRIQDVVHEAVGLLRASLPRNIAVADEKSDELTHGSGHLLFVEDDEDQIDTVPRVLEHIGYTVTATQDPVAALDLVERHPDRFDLVITDFDMPVIDGITLARKLGKAIPGVPVIVVTGRRTALEKAGPLDNVSRIVLKPYDRKAIARAIQEVLDKR